jgi:hypothetical protein
MSNFVYLISTTFLKDNTPINENVDDKLLKSAIKEAQEIYIRDVIGSGIYNELQTQAFAGTITNANTTLLDVYIAPCLKYYTLTESMLPMTFKMLNKTLGTRTSDNTQPVTIDEMTMVEQAMLLRSKLAGRGQKRIPEGCKIGSRYEMSDI